MESLGVVRVDVTTGKIAFLGKDKIAGFFPLADEVNSARVGALTLTVKDSPAKKSKIPFQNQRILQAADVKELIWEREIAAPVFLEPRP